MSPIIYLREQEEKHRWSEWWHIFGNFWLFAFAACVVIDRRTRWNIPDWMMWVFVAGFIVIALFAAFAQALKRGS